MSLKAKLIDILNERFGTDFKPGDQLFFDAIVEDAIADEKIRQAARVNTIENFMYVLKDALESLFIDRIDQEEGIVDRYMGDKSFHKVILENMCRKIYARIREEVKEAYLD